MAERICLMTSYPTECKEDCFNCGCGGQEATKDMYVSINNVQRVCSITGDAADTVEGKYIAEVIRNNLERMIDVDVQPVVTTEDLATVTEQFICKNCGIRIEDFSRIVLEEYDDGYVDKLCYEYRFKFCPECGAKIVDGGAENGNAEG